MTKPFALLYLFLSKKVILCPIGASLLLLRAAFLYKSTNYGLFLYDLINRVREIYSIFAAFLGARSNGVVN